MKSPALKISTVAVAVSIAAVAAVSYVQDQVVPEKAELIIRGFGRDLGLCAVPILIILAYRAWVKVIRPELPTWRNGLGLASMVILSAAWLFYAVLPILGSIRPSLTRFFNLEWNAALFYSSFAAALLAIALRGAPRTQVIAAALSMWAWLQANIYF